MTNGLGLLPYGNGVHYGSEPARRPTLHAAVAAGILPTSFATDNGVGLVYEGTATTRVVADRPGARAYRIEREAGSVRETPLDPDLLAA